MSASPLLPYIRTCGFCENGLLRFWVCPDDKRTVALCDECELYWDDVQAIYEDECSPSSGAFPMLKGDWRAGTRDDVSEAGLDNYVRGESE